MIKVSSQDIILSKNGKALEVIFDTKNSSPVLMFCMALSFHLLETFGNRSLTMDWFIVLIRILPDFWL